MQVFFRVDVDNDNNSLLRVCFDLIYAGAVNALGRFVLKNVQQVS